MRFVSEDHHSIFALSFLPVSEVSLDVHSVTACLFQVQVRMLHSLTEYASTECKPAHARSMFRSCPPTGGLDSVVQPPNRGASQTPTNHHECVPRLSQCNMPLHHLGGIDRSKHKADTSSLSFTCMIVFCMSTRSCTFDFSNFFGNFAAVSRASERHTTLQPWFHC